MADCSPDVIASIFSGEKEVWATSFTDLGLRRGHRAVSGLEFSTV